METWKLHFNKHSKYLWHGWLLNHSEKLSAFKILSGQLFLKKEWHKTPGVTGKGVIRLEIPGRLGAPR